LFPPATSTGRIAFQDQTVKTIYGASGAKLVQFHTIMIEKTNIIMQERLLDVLNKTSKQRYLEFIKKYPHKTQQINNKNLSSYLGVSHEFLSKIKKTI